MMAQYKDVGLGRGQALWHCLKARGAGVGRRETGQAKIGKLTGADLLRLHPPIAELTPEDLTGVYYRGITAVLSSVR